MKKLKTIIQRKKWNMILGISDIIMMIIASYLALLTRFEFYPSQIAPIFLKNAAKYMPLNLFCSIVIFMAYRLYSTQWKYAGISDFINVVKAAVIAAAFQLIGIYMYNGRYQEVTISCIWYICCWECFLSDYLSD